MTMIAPSNAVELLYGDIRIVETGLDDGSYVQIIFGLDEGESVLMPMAPSSDTDASSVSMFGMGMGGGGGTRRAAIADHATVAEHLPNEVNIRQMLAIEEDYR